MADSETVRCVVIGDKGVGKTCLLITFTSFCFPDEYIPGVVDQYPSTANVDGKSYKLELWDSGGTPEDYTRSAHVFLIAFSVVSPASLDNVKAEYNPNVSNRCPNTPVVLVGTKMDLRDDPNALKKLQAINQAPITTEHGTAYASEIGAIKYVETSALTQQGLRTAFDEALHAYLTRPKPGKASKSSAGGKGGSSRRGCTLL